MPSRQEDGLSRLLVRLGVTASAVFVLTVALAILVVTGERNLEDLRSVRAGMTRQHVIALLGPPLEATEIPPLALSRVEGSAKPCTDRVLYREQLRGSLARSIHDLVFAKGADFWLVCYDGGLVRDAGPIGPIIRSDTYSERPSNKALQLTKPAQAMVLRS